MASAKETPRQRMVGMMYLVLTALLALQVSSALIYKFQALNESLEKSSLETVAWNEKKLTRIEEEIKKRGSRPEEVKLLSSVKLINSKSNKVRDYIENLKKKLIKETGGYDEEGNLKGAKEETKVEVMMIGSAKNGKAYELKKKLDEYVKFMNENSETKFTRIALDGREDPLFKNNDDQKNKDFAELNFGQTPLVASLAVLSEMQSRITTMETTTLTALAEKVGIGDFKFDKVIPMVSPVSRVVAAGTKYEAKLFMTATSSSLTPQMEMGTIAVPVDGDGVGKISFTASGGNYGADGFAKKVWTGKIIMKKPDGKDTTYTVTEEYLVAKPVIEVKSGAVPLLYKNCGNKLNIQVPALGNSYNPRFAADGASIIQGTDRGMVTVIPSGTKPNVSLKVNNDGNYIGEQNFKVKLIPLPTIEIKVNGKPYNPVTGVADVRSIMIIPKADKDFAELLPNETTYRVAKVRVRKAKGRTGGAPIDFNSGVINIGPSLATNPNDRLIIEVLEIKRKNFKGEWEDVKIPETQAIFTVNVVE